MLFLNIYTGLGYFICTTDINWIHKVRVGRPDKRKAAKTHGLLGKKYGVKTYHGGNECIPKITITWIQLSYLTCVALFLNLSLWILDLHDKSFWIITELHRKKDFL